MHGQQENSMTLHLQDRSTGSRRAFPNAVEDGLCAVSDHDRTEAVLYTRLNLVLQSTINTEQILDIFFLEAQRLLSFDGISFSNAHHQLYFETGISADYSAHYRLFANQDYLGEVNITRNSTFSEEELEVLERLIAALISPLGKTLF